MSRRGKVLKELKGLYDKAKPILEKVKKLSGEDMDWVGKKIDAYVIAKNPKEKIDDLPF